MQIMASGAVDLDNPVQLRRQTECITLQTYHTRKLKIDWREQEVRSRRPCGCKELVVAVTSMCCRSVSEASGLSKPDCDAACWRQGSCRGPGGSPSPESLQQHTTMVRFITKRTAKFEADCLLANTTCRGPGGSPSPESLQQHVMTVEFIKNCVSNTEADCLLEERTLQGTRWVPEPRKPESSHLFRKKVEVYTGRRGV